MYTSPFPKKASPEAFSKTNLFIKMKNCNKTVAGTLNQMNESRNLLGK